MLPWQQGPTVGDLVPGSRLEPIKKKKKKHTLDNPGTPELLYIESVIPNLNYLGEALQIRVNL